VFRSPSRGARSGVALHARILEGLGAARATRDASFNRLANLSSGITRPLNHRWRTRRLRNSSRNNAEVLNGKEAYSGGTPNRRLKPLTSRSAPPL